MQLRSFLLSLPLVALLLTACNGKEKKTYYKEAGERFHTVYHITYESDRELTKEIDSTMIAFNDILNPFDPNSLISRFNRNETTELPKLLQDVVLQAGKVSQITGGVYDITGAPLFDLWGFGVKKGVTTLATDAQVDSVMQFVGYQKVFVDTVAHTMTKADPRLTINPSSISKGFVVDLVCKTLEENGVVNYMVEIGGEIRTKGKNSNGECWNIGINKPIEDSTGTVNELMYTIRLCDNEGLASSGDYRNFKEVEGVKLAHTMNVLTGRPAHQDILSATVIAPTCMEADAWATAFMAVGLEKAKEFLVSQPQLKVIFIYADPVTGEYTSYEHGVSPTPFEE